MGGEMSTEVQKPKNFQLHSELVTPGIGVFSVASLCLRILLCDTYCWDMLRK